MCIDSRGAMGAAFGYIFSIEQCKTKCLITGVCRAVSYDGHDTCYLVTDVRSVAANVESSLVQWKCYSNPTSKGEIFNILYIVRQPHCLRYIPSSTNIRNFRKI